ncbi:MAG TPA: retropepsin-like aspartic protease [Bryobacteraceae bacterium]|nr:retropepsin-like aspartic protease [Bryobacteraceae bacterium]
MIAPLLFAMVASTLPFTVKEHAIVIDNVFLNDKGPFRMLIDTGAQSTSVLPATAERANIRPRFRIEHVTASGSRVTPGGFVSIRAGSSQEDEVETIICELPAIASLIAIDGVLGQSWLQRFNYSIDYEAGAFTIGPAVPPGVRLSFDRLQGRIAIPVQVDGRRQILVVDSGTPTLVLFDGGSVGQPVMIRTNNGSLQVRQHLVRVEIAGMPARKVKAIRADTDFGPGLMPLRMFSSIYVNNRENYVVVGGR